jgi:hypothetical protein
MSGTRVKKKEVEMYATNVANKTKCMSTKAQFLLHISCYLPPV